jgi:hypothetical protein
VQKKESKKHGSFHQFRDADNLHEVGVQEYKLEDIAQKTALYGEVGKLKKLGKTDILTILKNAF